MSYGPVDEMHSAHEAISKQKNAEHMSGSFKTADNSNVGATKATGISGQSNYNGPEAWTGQPNAGPKLVDPRPAGNSSTPTFGKRGG